MHESGEPRPRRTEAHDQGSHRGSQVMEGFDELVRAFLWGRPADVSDAAAGRRSPGKEAGRPTHERGPLGPPLKVADHPARGSPSSARARIPRSALFTSSGGPNLLPMPDNLPLLRTSFVGRAEELPSLEELVGSHGLLTLTGAGGSGKTRLVLELARRLVDRFPAGVWWVDLSPVTAPGNVARAIASSLNVGAHAESHALTDLLIDHFRGRSLALLLDNCEHLIEAVGELVDRFTSACPGLLVLVTSREPLRVAGEVIYAVHAIAQGRPLRSRYASKVTRLLCSPSARGRSSRISFSATTTAGPYKARLEGVRLTFWLDPFS